MQLIKLKQEYHYPSDHLFYRNAKESQDQLYIKPYCRIPSYLVGLGLGYILSRKLQFKVRYRLVSTWNLVDPSQNISGKTQRKISLKVRFSLGCFMTKLVNTLMKSVIKFSSYHFVKLIVLELFKYVRHIVMSNILDILLPLLSFGIPSKKKGAYNAAIRWHCNGNRTNNCLVSKRVLKLAKSFNHFG